MTTISASSSQSGASPGTLLSHRVRGIIFDLDGTLYRMKWHLRPLMTLNLLPDPRTLPAFIRERERFAGKDLGDEEILMNAVFDAVAKKTGKTVGQVRTWVNGRFYPAFVSVMRSMANSRPGLDSLLRTLRQKGIRLAVLSDYSMVRERLTGIGIDPDLFDHLASSESRGALKPCPRPFLEIAAEWDLAAGEIAVVGDRGDTDGQAASGAGMAFVQVDGGFGSKASRGGKPWEEVRKLLQQISCT